MEISPSVSRFYSGEFAMMMFGLPGAGLAMYHTAYSAQKLGKSFAKLYALELEPDMVFSSHGNSSLVFN